MRFCLQFVSLRLMQHPIDAMLQFDPNAHANVDASMNEALRVNRPDKISRTIYIIINIEVF